MYQALDKAGNVVAECETHAECVAQTWLEYETNLWEKGARRGQRPLLEIGVCDAPPEGYCINFLPEPPATALAAAFAKESAASVDALCQQARKHVSALLNECKARGIPAVHLAPFDDGGYDTSDCIDVVIWSNSDASCWNGYAVAFTHDAETEWELRYEGENYGSEDIDSGGIDASAWPWLLQALCNALEAGEFETE